METYEGAYISASEKNYLAYICRDKPSDLWKLRNKDPAEANIPIQLSDCLNDMVRNEQKNVITNQIDPHETFRHPLKNNKKTRITWFQLVIRQLRK